MVSNVYSIYLDTYCVTLNPIPYWALWGMYYHCVIIYCLLLLGWLNDQINRNHHIFSRRVWTTKGYPSLVVSWSEQKGECTVVVLYHRCFMIPFNLENFSLHKMFFVVSAIFSRSFQQQQLLTTSCFYINFSVGAHAWGSENVFWILNRISF